MTTPQHIAVLMGGRSHEREASLATGAACAKALEADARKITCIDVGDDLCDALTRTAPDKVFNALHGTWGEDGCVQGLLEMLRLPYTHSGVLASALSMHKEKAKVIFRAAGLSVAESRTASRFDAARTHILPPPYIVKPLTQGSSVGVYAVHDGANSPPEILATDDWVYGDEVMVEPYIDGRELTCAIFDDTPSDVMEVVKKGAFYDYTSKYDKKGAQHILPARIDARLYKDVQRVAHSAHRALGCRGATRADFMWSESDGLVLLEVNTQPGMTPASLLPELAIHAGMSFPAFVEWMLEDASCNR